MGGRFEVVLRSPTGDGWQRFSDPVRSIVARDQSEVRAALAAVDAALGEGFHVAGFVAYEAAGAFGLPVGEKHPTLPLVEFGLYDGERIEDLSRLVPSGRAATGEWLASVDHGTYLRAISAIKQRIEAGDTYQINFTFRLTASFSGEPSALMRDLYAAQAGHWSAFIDAGSYAICSASPELFFRKQHDRLACLPMKGTAARGWWPAQDVARGAELHASAKNRAENVMIVDMVRNDLGRIAASGSVRVPSLFDVERYPLQWQMTSRVEADAPDASLSRVLEAMFPSGSVTGAPKHSAMTIIRDIESTPRGIYTGAIGYLSPEGNGYFNVAIRTAVVDRQQGTAEFGVGSGVVWDSIDRDEYDECLIKARMVTVGSGERVVGSSGDRLDIPSYVIGEQPDFSLLETLRWDPGSGFRLLDRHLARLRASADCFGFARDLADFEVLLNTAVAELSAPARVRLRLQHDGTVLCEAVDLEDLQGEPLRAALAREPVDEADVFLFHKTTRRGVYDRARASRPDAGAVILWNRNGDVTEATDFNLVIEMEGRRITPPVGCGLLPGTFREELLEQCQIFEARVRVEDLQAAGKGWLINSVRGWVPFVI